jgi:hypothetical protein
MGQIPQNTHQLVERDSDSQVSTFSSPNQTPEYTLPRFVRRRLQLVPGLVGWRGYLRSWPQRARFVHLFSPSPAHSRPRPRHPSLTLRSLPEQNHQNSHSITASEFPPFCRALARSDPVGLYDHPHPPPSILIPRGRCRVRASSSLGGRGGATPHPRIPIQNRVLCVCVCVSNPHFLLPFFVQPQHRSHLIPLLLVVHALHLLSPAHHDHDHGHAPTIACRATLVVTCVREG